MKDDKYKFLIACPQRASGGAERVSVLLASELVRQGHKVLYLQFFENEQDYPLDEKVDLILLEMKARNPIFKKVERVIKTIRYVKSQDVDFVIPFLGKMVDLCFWATRFQKKKTFISTIRINPEISPKNKINRWWRNIICFLSDGVFVQNSEQRKYFPSFMQNKIFAVPNPINPEIEEKDYSLKCGKVKRIVTAGRLTKQKNHKLLIDAFNIIKNDFSDIQLVIYGEGELKEELCKIVNNDNQISLPGRVKTIQDHYRDGDIFVLSSDFEGMPNALMEAMAMGIPSISTNCPTGPSDIIDSFENGILISCNDLDGLVDALKYFILNSKEAMEMGINGKKYILTTYNAEAVTKKLIGECEKIRGNKL